MASEAGRGVPEEKKACLPDSSDQIWITRDKASSFLPEVRAQNEGHCLEGSHDGRQGLCYATGHSCKSIMGVFGRVLLFEKGMVSRSQQVWGQP